MHKFLVTGGAGFIGSNITKKLLEDGYAVRVLDNFSSGKRENIEKYKENDNFELIEGDIRSYHIVRAAVKDIDYVLHQAALPSVQRSVNDPITTNDVNILGTLNILEASRELGVKRVVYASSSSIYGSNPDLPKVETMPPAPISPYALSKYTAERYCQIYSQIYGLETVALRYFNVFGPNQNPNSQYSAVIPIFIKAILEDRQPTIFGDGKQSRDFTFVYNNVMANIRACFAENVSGEVFNIACGESYSLLDLIDEINRILGKNIEPLFAEKRVGDVKQSLAGTEKAKTYLGYEIEYSFIEGLRRTIKSLS